MNQHPDKHFRILAASLFSIACGIFGANHAYAEDTDIYFSNPNAVQSTVRSNIMLILDTSGSMNTTVSGTGMSRLDNMKAALNTIIDTTNNVNMGLMRFSGSPGGPVLFPIADLDALASTIEGATTSSSQVILSLNTDDAEENASTGAMTLNSATLKLINTGSVDQRVGLRFQNINIPQGATITSARIQFDAASSDSGATSLTIYGQAGDNAATFSTSANDISGRAPTTASVDWSSLSSWSTGTTYSTPDLAPIVQEIINRSGWCGGNAMAFKFAGSGTRTAVSYDGNPANAPVLIVTYDPATIPAAGGCIRTSVQNQIVNGNDDAEERLSTGNISRSDTQLELAVTGSGRSQMIGLRFPGLTVPKNATILSASLEFQIRTQQGSAGTTALTIHGEASNNAASISISTKDLSNRTSTSASVAWSNLANPAAGTKIQSPDLTAIVQEIVNRSGWASGNAMVMLIDGSGTRGVQAYDGSASGAPVLRVTYQDKATATTTSNKTVRQRLKEIVAEMKASGLTPIVDTLYEAGLYYRGQGVDYGKKRGSQSGTTAQYTRVSHPASYTGATGVYRATGCTDTDLNNAACVTEAIQGSPSYISPFSTAGCQKNFIVLLTDGDPTVNNSVTKVQTLIGKNCATSIYGADAKCSDELVEFLHTVDQSSSRADKQTITTYTIGFGSDGDPAYLKAMAKKGGGGFYTATTAADLVTAFSLILNDVLANPTSFVSPSLSVNAFNKLFNRDEVYFSLFTPALEQRWAGNVKKFKLCADTTGVTCTFGEVMDATPAAAIGTDPNNTATYSKILSTSKSYWSAATDGATVTQGGTGENIPAYGSRNVYTYTGTTDAPTSATDADLTSAAHLVTTGNANLTKTLLGDAAMTDQQRLDIINWMRGQDLQDENANGSTTDNRWKFTDALHSRPIPITYGGTASDPVMKLLVGTNDGGLRMINAKNGEEEWIVYLPTFLSKQATLMDNAQGAHIYGLDGTASVWVQDNNNNGKIEPTSPNNDKVYLFIGMRRGGRDIYALDITPSAELTDPAVTNGIKPKYLWRIRGGTGDNFGALGQTWSKPTVATIRVKCTGGSCTTGDSQSKTVLIFSGGYDPAQDDVMPSGADTMGNAIYIVDPADGSLVWSAGGAGSGAALELANMKYSIPSDIALMDSNGDGAINRLYVGDTRGQLWRIDLDDQINPSGNNAAQRNGNTAGYVFADVGCTAGVRSNNCSATDKTLRRKFFYPPDVAQARETTFSSTEDYDLVSIASGDREDPLDKVTEALTIDPVHNRIYAFRDVNVSLGAPATTPTTLTDTDLYDATGNALQDPNGVSYASALASIRAKKGWYIDLMESSSPQWIGEKGLAKTTIFDGVLYATTFTPHQNTGVVVECPEPAEGTGKVYALNYLNGTAMQDLDKNGTLDRSLTIGGGIPSELVIVIREGGVSTLIGTSGGASQPNIDATLPRYTTYWYDD